MSKSIAYSVEGMRRGDVYLDEDGAVLIRDSEKTGVIHHIGPFGDHWMVSRGIAWPATRVFKQNRGDCEDPREFNKKLEKGKK